jgi:nicotinate-nucleotide pyrophosphorylase (carboxylating)
MSYWHGVEPRDWQAHVHQSLDEDLGSGDITAPLFLDNHRSRWYIEMQSDGILCGLGIADYLAKLHIDAEVDESSFRDGDFVRHGDRILVGCSPTAHLLAIERTMLNYLMILSGTATNAHRYVEAVAGTACRITETRKTIPGMRRLQKYAVRAGGGFNHRMGLYDAAMIKDNHISAVGGITDAVRTLRDQISHMTRIEVECESLVQVEEAINAGADVVLLDNMSLELMREAVVQFGSRVTLEASGGISLETVAAVAATGVHIVSVGSITYQVQGLAMHLEIG